jgi:hypothetical protein
MFTSLSLAFINDFRIRLEKQGTEIVSIFALFSDSSIFDPSTLRPAAVDFAWTTDIIIRSQRKTARMKTERESHVKFLVYTPAGICKTAY